MVDNTNPIRQFHPYQAMRDVPASERQAGAAKTNADKIRDWGKAHPGTLLGGLAGAAIGFGVMRRMRD